MYKTAIALIVIGGDYLLYNFFILAGCDMTCNYNFNPSIFFSVLAIDLVAIGVYLLYKSGHGL